MKDFNDWYGFLVTLSYAAITIWLTAYLMFGLGKLLTGLLKSVFKQSAVKLKDFKSSKSTVLQPGGPPKLAEYALYFFLCRRDRINLIGDLEEEFRNIEAKFGRRLATIWYCKQIVTSIGPQVRNALVRWASLAWLGEWARRHL